MFGRERKFCDLVGKFKAVALIANNDALDVDAVETMLPEDTLHVFYGQANVLSCPGFSRPSVLFHHIEGATRRYGMSERGRRTGERNLSAGGFLGDVGIISQRYSKRDFPADLADADVEPAAAHLIDARSMTRGWYPENREPSTGFSTALWFRDRFPNVPLYLCGFTGVVGDRFKLVTHHHHFTLEQAVLLVETRKGGLHHLPDAVLPRTGYTGLVARYPDMDPADLAGFYADAITRRIDASDDLLQRAWRKINPQIGLRKNLGRLGLGGLIRRR